MSGENIEGLPFAHKGSEDKEFTRVFDEFKKELSQGEDEQERFVKDFYKDLPKFPTKSQELISSLSDAFLEEDIYQKMKKNTQSVSQLLNTFRKQGMKEKDIWKTTVFFGFPYSGINQNKK